MVLESAVQTDPHKRYAELSEFVFDLQQPNPQWLHGRTGLPLIERNPATFWKGVSVALALLVVLLLWRSFNGPAA